MAKQISKEEKEQAALREIFRKSSTLTTDEIGLLRKNAIDNVLGRFAQRLKDIQKVDPSMIKKILEEYGDKFDASFNTIQDVINHVNGYFDYYDCIKTQEELEIEFERANRFIKFEGMDLPIVVEFDYQYFGENALFQKPTFYSYYNSKTETDYGKGAYHIAFPSTQKYLTDEEVMVAMKHEWGHVFQGHCTIAARDKFEERYNNQSMDISINLGMTPEEQELLFSVARKIWKNPTACPCMSLAKPSGQGGFGIDYPVSPTNWRGTSGFIRAYYEKEFLKGQGKGEGQPQPGGGGGGEGGQGGDQPPVSEKIKVGDFVWKPGSDPKIYGRVNAINEQTGEVAYDEYTESEWAQIKENIKNS